MGQSHLLVTDHFLETDLSMIRSLIGSVSSVGSFAGDDSFSGLESLTLSCNPKLSPAGQQTAKHDGLYPLLSVSLTMPPFVEGFQQRDDPCHVCFNTLAFLSFHTTSFWLSNVASLAISFHM